MSQLEELRAQRTQLYDTLHKAVKQRDAAEAENERLRAALDAAIRAANLALFVIRKQGIMPNSSWQAGFERDMKAATDARGAVEQKAPENKT